jgi:hypothetical protein
MRYDDQKPVLVKLMNLLGWLAIFDAVGMAGSLALFTARWLETAIILAARRSNVTAWFTTLTKSRFAENP